MTTAARLRFAAGKRGPRADVPESDREAERARVIAALQAAAGVERKAARAIGMPLRTFARKIAEFEIDARSYRNGPPEERKKRLVGAIAEGDWTVAGAARIIGVSRTTIDRWVEEFDIPTTLLPRKRK